MKSNGSIKCDAYVLVYLEGRDHKPINKCETEAINDRELPKFNHQCTAFYKKENQRVRIEMRDNDVASDLMSKWYLKPEEMGRSKQLQGYNFGGAYNYLNIESEWVDSC